ncbi:MAG: hypothetical protein IPP82_12955 [Xanthomonadales bacterium]|nr:hypothetical protein [Xanthomonadales bacterium]
MIRKILTCALLVAAGPALAVDGLLDSSFGIFSSGRNVAAPDQGGTNSDKLADVLVGADGAVFLVGTTEGSGGTSRYSITKMTANGILDNSFGTNGTVLSGLTSVVANRARLDSAGNILIAGSRGFSGMDRDFSLCRYNQLGQPVNFSALTSHCLTVAFDVSGGNLTDVANDVIVEPSGKIVLAGIAGFSATRDLAAVARLMPDGTLDTTFNTDGKNTEQATIGKLNHFNAIAVQPDGKYIAVGETGDPTLPDGTAALFSRLTTSGNFDPSYNSGAGYSTYSINIGDPFFRNESATRITILGNGKILMGGTSQYGSSSNKLLAFVYRINPSTQTNVDPSFGTAGVAKLGGGFAYELGDMLVQSDGKIVLIGTDSPTSGSARDMHIIRLLSNGSTDNDDFGTIARTTIDFVLPGELDFGISGALQNGRIIVAGHSLRAAPQNYDLTVAGLSNDLIFADNFDGQ